MPELVISGIVLAPIVAGLVELAKHYGLPSGYAPWLNLLLSALAGGLVLFIQAKPELLTPVVLCLQVIILFLSTAGFYTTAKWAVGK